MSTLNLIHLLPHNKPTCFYFTAEMVITITLNRLEPYQKIINIKFIWVIHCLNTLFFAC